MAVIELAALGPHRRSRTRGATELARAAGRRARDARRPQPQWLAAALGAAGSSSRRHARCAAAFQGACTHATNGASSSGDPDSLDMAGLVFGRDLADMRPCPPPIVTACIDAVEAHAMDYEGIYRKSGGTGQVRLISAVFDRGETPDLADLERFNDVSATTSALKSASRDDGWD